MSSILLHMKGVSAPLSSHLCDFIIFSQTNWNIQCISYMYELITLKYIDSCPTASFNLHSCHPSVPPFSTQSQSDSANVLACYWSKLPCSGFFLGSEFSSTFWKTLTMSRFSSSVTYLYTLFPTLLSLISSSQSFLYYLCIFLPLACLSYCLDSRCTILCRYPCPEQLHCPPCTSKACTNQLIWREETG